MLLSVSDLATSFGATRAVDGVSIEVAAGRTLGIVGESGCGKSVLSLSIMRLLTHPGRVTAGAVRFDGQDLLGLSPRGMRQLRGRDIAMIFQEPMTSLNPVHSIGFQLVEALRAHNAGGEREAIEALRRVRLPDPAAAMRKFPHQLSGGMRQRVMIAMAIACKPKLLIADEPTTALDVTVQAQILDLLRDLQAETGMGLILITHDLGVIAEMADEVAVMYAGRVVERAPAKSLFDDPQHPYTLGLLGSIPRLDLDRERLTAIEGAVPQPHAWPPGCRFAPRCPFAEPACEAAPPPLREMAPDARRAGGPGHQAACIRAPL